MNRVPCYGRYLMWGHEWGLGEPVAKPVAIAGFLGIKGSEECVYDQYV